MSLGEVAWRWAFRACAAAAHRSVTRVSPDSTPWPDGLADSVAQLQARAAKASKVRQRLALEAEQAVLQAQYLKDRNAIIGFRRERREAREICRIEEDQYHQLAALPQANKDQLPLARHVPQPLSREPSRTPSATNTTVEPPRRHMARASVQGHVGHRSHRQPSRSMPRHRPEYRRQRVPHQVSNSSTGMPGRANALPVAETHAQTDRWVRDERRSASAFRMRAHHNLEGSSTRGESPQPIARLRSRSPCGIARSFENRPHSPKTSTYGQQRGRHRHR